MASLRRKYQTHVELPRHDDAPVGAAARPSAAAPPPVTEHAAPPEDLKQEAPEKVAAQEAIRSRLAEMENAERAVAHPVEPPRAPEPRQQPQPEMPASVRKWLSEHPQYMNPKDEIAQAEINLAAQKCIRDGLTWNDDDFLPSMERHLGIAQGNGKHLPPSEPVKPPYNGAPPRPSPVAPRPAYNTQPPAAPPSRDQGYSLQTGRRIEPLRPTALDQEGARIAGISIEDYMRGKQRFEAEKRAGLHNQ